MTLAAGTRLGPYEVTGDLGAGGMGEVYRGRDATLNRDVAIKVLPASLASDPERLTRFRREAQVLASLNHPNVAHVYGFEGATLPDGSTAHFLAMELVLGEDLSERLKRGAIPIDEAVAIAKQIAEGLEEAHERGIVHRDLKPANVKVTPDGKVKVLDFGLAKALEADPTTSAANPPLSHSPTMSRHATEAGLIMGTAAYMSPEQARGRPVDKRTDVWAFGAVLYEMLTGARAFDGEDTTELIAAVVKTTPNWSALPGEVPPHVVTLIQRCLEKDRKERIGDIAVARFLLADHGNLGASPTAATQTARAAPTWRRTLPWVLAAVLVGTALGWLGSRQRGGALPVTHLLMSVHPADQLVASPGSVRPSRTALAVAPDGRQVVFSATHGTVTQLYARGFDQAEATPVPGTEGASGPFFSPDGAWIGFWADDKLKKVPTAGGPTATISDAQGVGENGLLGGSWGENDTIVFANGAGLSRVSAAGGTAALIAPPDTSRRERLLLPQALPGGKALLFTAMTGLKWETADVVLQSLDTGERRVLVRGGADARYVRTGHLVYVKNGTLMAVPFDVRSRQVTGAPVALIEGVMQAVNAPLGSDETGAGQFAVSESGTLLYVVGGIGPIRKSSLMWVDRTGTAEPLAAVPAGAQLSPRLSPDGQRLTVFKPRGASRECDVWVYDVRRGAPSRLTLAGGNVNPVWSPDGKRLVYASDANAPGVYDLYVINADGSGAPERLTTMKGVSFPSSWAPTTNVIAFVRSGGPNVGATNAIWIVAMEGDRKPWAFLESSFSLMYPDFSPDGRWIAYVSNESGANEVYVQPYPGPGEKIRISTDGGSQPIWTANGKELLYTGGIGASEERFFSVAIRSLSPFWADVPRLLFEARPREYVGTMPVRGWDVSADGQRFLLMRPIPSTDPPVTAIHVVQNWTEELKRRVPTK